MRIDVCELCMRCLLMCNMMFIDGQCLGFCFYVLDGGYIAIVRSVWRTILGVNSWQVFCICLVLSYALLCKIVQVCGTIIAT